MDAATFRAQFPVFDRIAYLNAGTDGPLPRAAADAVRGEIEREETEGRWTMHSMRRMSLTDELREVYAGVLGCDPTELALTTSTTEGLGKVLAGLTIGPGDEIVTSDAEHPGLIGPLIAARARGASIRVVPFAELAEAVRPSTTFVACSHVNWITGEVAPSGLSEVDVPVIFDGAQGVGAIPVDVRNLRCAAYAGAGQKWLCGPDGSGMLYIAPELRERVGATAPGYMSFADTSLGFSSPLREDVAVHDTPSLSAEGLACALGGQATLANAGWHWVHQQAAAGAERLAEMLREAGRTVAPRGRTTLVSWHDEDPVATAAALAERGVVVRSLPGRPLLRASVGAWTSDEDLERLVSALG